MMKKFLALSLVLGMVALANAGIYITVNGADVDSYVATPGEMLQIGVANNDNQGQYNAALVLELGGAWTGTSVVLKNIGTAAGWEYIGVIEGYGDMWMGWFAQGIVEAIPNGVTGQVGFSAIAPISVIRMENDSAEVLDMVTITTPEPMTMVLLGLGGLFLRKKK